MYLDCEEVMFEQMQKDLKAAVGELLFSKNDDETQAKIKLIVENWIENEKFKFNGLDNFDADISIDYNEVVKGYKLTLIPKNKETFKFFVKNNPSEYYNYGWSDEFNKIIMYM